MAASRELIVAGGADLRGLGEATAALAAARVAPLRGSLGDRGRQ